MPQRVNVARLIKRFKCIEMANSIQSYRPGDPSSVVDPRGMGIELLDPASMVTPWRLLAFNHPFLPNEQIWREGARFVPEERGAERLYIVALTSREIFSSVQEVGDLSQRVVELLITVKFAAPSASPRDVFLKITFETGTGPTLAEVQAGLTLDEILRETTEINGLSRVEFERQAPATARDDFIQIDEPLPDPGVAPQGGRVFGLDGNDTIWGGSQNDQLFGGNGSDMILGNLGDDSLAGGMGDDTIRGGEGSDTLYGGQGSDVLDGGDGDDLIEAGLGNDVIDGGAGNDLIRGWEGHDTIDAGTGHDTVIGYRGYDSIRGGEGDDVIWAGTSPDETGRQWDRDTVHGGPGNDLIGGAIQADVLHGGDGDDTIWAGSGDDYVTGGSGADVIHGQEDDDRIFGGSGNDQIWGGAGADTIYAGVGDDSVYGGSGSDMLEGEAGNDFLLGDGDRALPADDTLNGGDGDDTLQAGGGNNLLQGGLDADVFVFDTADGAGRDIIVDFEDSVDRLSIIGFQGASDAEYFALLDIQAGNIGPVQGVNVAFETQTFETRTVFLTGITLSEIDATDFLFV